MSSTDHHDDTHKGGDGRWHLSLHPDVQKQDPRSALSHFGTLIHPTHVTLKSSSGQEEDMNWTSRDHRKHRHVSQDPNTGRTRRGQGDLTVLHKILNLRRIEYWNASWWVAMLFTVGSIVWVINGFIAFLPFVNTHVAKDPVGDGWTVWIGATIFEFGALCGLWEAWNRDDTADFGYGVRRLLSGKDQEAAVGSERKEAEQLPRKKWIWYSTEGKYFHELGFLAAFVQYLAATIFWISGFTAIPQVQNSIESKTAILDVFFWTPQVVGGTGFVIASALMMLETQKKWYLPAPTSLGWHVGFWNLVGGVGFALCGALGYGLNDSTKVAYQSSCSTFWGGWAFLIGSVIQWYEAVNPV
ncbi:hypothetical protein FB45DRAFT_907686 [Roridomyces roridus]|uniref:Integral membrane protein n=1 Tax=Roridomyces roridus TaxID=1738132 RepID=A0AAD7C3S5_9AGAR|nr:hypothetical protein FB45DRAFT_907686 [Roridomyces roridus]